MFFKSKTFEVIVVVIGVLAVLFLVFKAGELVKSREVEFSQNWGQNYYHNIVGPRPYMMDVNSRDFISGSGVVGSIIKIDPSVNSEQATLTIQDERDNTEKTVLIAKDTIIRQFQNAIELADLKVTDHVVVVGSPNSSGQIEAKLVRVVPETMEMMSPASGPAPFAQPL